MARRSAAREPGEVLSGNELLDKLWRCRIGGDEALTNAVVMLRKAFGDDAHHASIIGAIPKQGYRPNAGVTPAAAQPQR